MTLKNLKFDFKQIPPIAWVMLILCLACVFFVVIRFGNLEIGIGDKQRFSIRTGAAEELAQIKELVKGLKDMELVSGEIEQKKSIPTLPFPEIGKDVMRDQINIIYILLLDIYCNSKDNPKLNYTAEHMLQDILQASEFIRKLNNMKGTKS